MGKYDAVAERSLAQIERKGVAVKFPGAAPGTYDPLTNTWSGSASGDVFGKAVQIDGDPDTLAALGLIGVDNATLMVGNRFTDAAADGAEVAFEPLVPAVFEWPVGGKSYTIRKADDVAPNGEAIIYILTGAV